MPRARCVELDALKYPILSVFRKGTPPIFWRKMQGLPDFGFLGSLSLEHRPQEVKRNHAGGFSMSICVGLSLKMQPRNK